ncbi:unnamed protein product [Tenebrio molitor]|jgi:hypothetical protein|nr:unnamed protein product [Tenebrio molitor]
MNERKKMKYTHHSGAGDDTVYKPSLWYFDKLEFLNDHLNMRSSKSNVAITNNTADKAETEVFLIECSTDDIDVTTAAPDLEDSHSQLFESEDFSILENQENNYSEGEFSTPSTSTPKEPGMSDHNKVRRNKGKKHDNDDTISCLKALTDAASKLVEMPVTPDDAAKTGDDTEDVLFGKYVGTSVGKIRKKRLKVELKQAIQSAIYDIQIRELENDH